MIDQINENLMEVITSKRKAFDGVMLHLEQWTVNLPNGASAPREVIIHGGASAVVPVDDDGNVILVRQCRIAMGRVTTEIPAGKLDHVGEDPLEAARRELSEETGMTASEWTKLTVMDTTPAFCTEKIHIYLARGLSEGESHPDEDEFVDAVRIPLQDAVDMVMCGELHDGKTCLGLLMAAKLLSSDK